MIMILGNPLRGLSASDEEYSLASALINRPRVGSLHSFNASNMITMFVL